MDPGLRRDDGGWGKQAGYLLLPVAVAIALIGVIAFLISSESAIEVNMTTGELDAARAEYVAQAGMQHALRLHAQQGCGPYTDLTNYPFGTDEYDTRLSHDLGGTAAYTVNVEQDTWIRDDFPTNNYATDTKMHIRNEGGVIERPLLRYDLSAVPAKAAILSARAWFYVNMEHSEGPVDIHQITTDWTDTDATWDSMGANIDDTVIATVPTEPGSGVWVSVNLTAQVQAWINGEPNYGITIDTNSAGVHSEYLTSESAFPPYVEVLVGTPPTSPAKLKSTSKIDGGGAASIKREVTLIQHPPASVVLQLGTDPGEDAMLDSFYGLRNYGGANYMQVHDNESDWQQYPLIRFHLNRLPQGAVIHSALLELRLTNLNAPGSAMVHQVTRDWVEGTRSGGGTADGANWSTYDGTNAWTTAGGDINSTVVAETAINGGETWVAWDVTQLVERWSSGVPNYGLLIKPDTALSQARFASKEDSDPALWPRLTISYSCTCGEVCVAPQSSGNLLMVVLSPTVLVDEDQKAKDLFESWGYTVSVISESANQASYDAAVAANDVVFISETVNSNSVGTKLANAPIGVVSQDGDYNPDLGLATGAALKVGNAIDIVDTDHYITRPFTADSHEIYAADMEQAIVTGSLTADQRTLGENGGDGALVALDKGDAMEGGGSAAGRRVILPLGTRYRFDWNYLNANGRLLVQRSLAWAMGSDVKVSGKLLLVVANAGSPSTSESDRRALIESWGYEVTLISDDAPQTDYDTALADVDVVYITGSGSSTEVGTKLTAATVGVLSEDIGLVDELGIAEPLFVKKNSQHINVIDNTHYVTSGFGLGALQLYTYLPGIWTVTGSLAPGLQILGETQDGVGTYPPGLAFLETGAELYGGGFAAGRRVQVPWSEGSFDINALNDDGRTIMRRAIEWGAGAILVKEPIAHWKLDETTGSTAVDSIAGHDGNLANGPLWTPGILAGGLAFDGVDDSVGIGPDAALDNLAGGKVTLSAWIYASGWGEGLYGRIVDKSNATFPTAGWALELYGPIQGLLFQHRFSGGLGSWSTPAGSIKLNTWHHVALVYDGSSAANDPEIYIDGVAQTIARSGSFSGSPVDDSAIDLTIGNHAQSTVRTFEGTLDDIRLFDSLLSAAEIAELAIPPGPVAHWKLDDGSGPTAADSVGGNDATLNGDPAWTTGTLSGALEFDGSGDYATTDNNFTPPPVGTVLFWMKVPGSPGSHGRILGLHDTWEVRHVTTGTSAGIPHGLVFDLGVTGVNTEFVTTVTVDTPDQWYFVAATYDTNSDAYQVFLDGALHKSGTYPSSLTVPAAAPLSLGTRTGSSNYFTGTLDDVQIFNRILSASEIADLYAAGAPPTPGYFELHEPWTASNSDAWETVSLASFGVPANAVVEVAVINEATSAQRWGGVRAVGSSLDRRFQLQEAEGGGSDVVTMHVQADSSSQIEHYSDNTTDISFVLIGFWTVGSYVELFDPFTANSSNAWVAEDVGDDGLGANQVAEIAMVNTNTGRERMAGLRTPGSGYLRRFDLHEAESGGVDAVSLMVATDASASVEVYAESASEVDFYVLGYWSTPPGTYTEFGGTNGRPTAADTWQVRDLSSFGVPADSITQFVITNTDGSSENRMGVRAVGSTQARLLDPHKAEAGGDELLSLHVNVDSGMQIEWRSASGASNGFFYPVGWWVLSP